VYLDFPAIVVGLPCGKFADSYSVCIFLNLQIYQIFSFLCSQQYKEFCIKFCVLVGYIIDYVHICFHNSLKFRNLLFIFKNEWITRAQDSGAKNTSEILLNL
jgi:hypothetical protein